MSTIIDLSHPILDQSSCTFRVDDNVPKFLFVQDERNGNFYFNSEWANFPMNYGTHITFPSSLSLPHDGINFSESGLASIKNFIGKVLVIDASKKMQPLFDYFDKNGIFKINPENVKECTDFLSVLDSLKIDQIEFEKILVENNLLLTDVVGVLFHTGLSQYWTYKKFEAWEYIYFCGLDLGLDLCDFFSEKKIRFLGIDSFGIGNAIENFSGLEKPFVLSEVCQQYIKDRNLVLRYAGARVRLLSKNISLYENLKIPKSLVNQRVDFFGPPLNIGLNPVVCCSPVRPFVCIE